AAITASAFVDIGSQIARILALIIAVLSSISTFLNPNEKASAHLRCGNDYDALQNRVRIFSTIDCWQEESDQVLTERLKHFSEQKDKLNGNSPQPGRFSYWRAKKGILA